MTPRSRRSAGEPVQSRTPPPHGLPCWPDRARAAYANADALDDRAYSRAAAAQPLSLADSRELSRHRTDHTAVSSRGRSRRERRRAEQRSSEHHGDNALAREHHASLRLAGFGITAAPQASRDLLMATFVDAVSFLRDHRCQGHPGPRSRRDRVRDDEWSPAEPEQRSQSGSGAQRRACQRTPGRARCSAAAAAAHAALVAPHLRVADVRDRAPGA
jgi:hypothetical protein